MVKKPSLTQILEVETDHHTLAEILWRHQEALVGMEFTQALGALEEFARRLSRHIRIEEEHVIPAYAELGEFMHAGKPDVFIEEHRKIEQRTKDLLSATRSLTLGAGARRAVILLLERETHLKELLNHHVKREDSILFPRLKEHLAGDGHKKAAK